MKPDPQKIIAWLGAQGISLVVGDMAWGKRTFARQDGRHSHENYDMILNRVRENEKELVEYLLRRI